MSTGFGLQQKIREKLSAFNGDIQVHNYDTNQSEVSLNPISIHQNFYPKFNEVPQIVHIQAVALRAGIIRTPSTFEGVIVKGVGTDYNWKEVESFLQQGHLPNYKQGQVSEQILISSYLANRLGLKLNDKCPILFLREQQSGIPIQRNFTIVGIYNSGFQDFDASYIFADIQQIQRINQWTPDQIGNFELFVDNFDNLNDIVKSVYLKTPSYLDVQSITSKYAFIFEWFKMFDFNILLIIAIMVFVGGINMITALLVLIFERTPMIGLLKSIGASNWSIQKIFLYNAGYLVFQGILLGNIIAIALITVQSSFGILKLNPDIYYVSEIPIYLSWKMLVILNFGVFILCMAMLWGASYWISKVNPIKSIKFD